jgi:hypothetical protein
MKKWKCGARGIRGMVLEFLKNECTEALWVWHLALDQTGFITLVGPGLPPVEGKPVKGLFKSELEEFCRILAFVATDLEPEYLAEINADLERLKVGIKLERGNGCIRIIERKKRPTQADITDFIWQVGRDRCGDKVDIFKSPVMREITARSYSEEWAKSGRGKITARAIEKNETYKELRQTKTRKK